MKIRVKNLVVIPLVFIFISVFLINSNFLSDATTVENNSLILLSETSPYMFFEKIGEYASNSYDVVVVDEIAYLADGDDGLKILNISDLTAPVEIGVHDDGGEATGLFVSGDIVFLADGTDGLEIINVSDPTSPVEIGQQTHGTVTNVFVDEENGWITSDGWLALWDISDLSDPDPMLYGMPSTQAAGVHVYDGYAYVAEGTSGLRIYDGNHTEAWISVISTFYDSSGSTYDVFVDDDIAYVADGYDGLEMLDVSNPSAPVEIGQYTDGFAATGVFVNDGFAYVAKGLDGLGIIDVSNPSSPFEVGNYTSLSECNRTFALSGISNYIFAADIHNGLEIIEFSFDNDWDGLTNYEEIFIYNTNPLANDTDLDLLTDYQELMIYSSNPLIPDEDDDFLLDGEEILGYYAPTNPGANATGYVLTNFNDSDSDDDTFIDGIEIYYNTNPNDVNSYPEPTTVTPPPVTITPPPETITSNHTVTTTVETGYILTVTIISISVGLLIMVIIRKPKK
ncbi:MAG: hypothetical protein FK733_16395 [Asgard group archaeon]|nr:hypothetical protein [Asgard group archaeon]